MYAVSKCIYTVYIVQVCSAGLYVQLYSHTLRHIWDEAINPLTSRKYTILNGNFVFNPHSVFHEHNSDLK